MKQPDALEKLFRDVGKRFVGRPGGFVRVLKVRNRAGDSAPMSIVELVVKGAELESTDSSGTASQKAESGE